jgi:aspartate kinase
MALIVQKYGGTSVADAAARERIVGKVRAARERGDRVVLVVSAMGRRGAPYATDTLLDLLDGFGATPDVLASDLLASCGELISACLVSVLLCGRGIPAAPLSAYTAGIKAEGPRGDATPTAVDASALVTLLEKGLVPVIAGFQGVGPDGAILTLGRGGSDTSAVAVGIALEAAYVDIYTDVPGVAKADPRVVKDVPFMEFLDYDSMFRLAKHGARVLHDRSALLAERGRALLRVRSTFDEGEGTLIGPPEAAPGGRVGTPDFIGLASAPGPEGRTRVTAVFAKGRSGPGREAAMKAIAASAFPCAIAEVPAGDQDAFSLICETDAAGDLARVLFAALV